MGKYLQVLRIGVQNTLVYRVNFLFRATVGLVPLAGTLYLWRAVYAGKAGAEVGGYALSQMISYYLLVTLVDAFTAVAEDDWQVAADIKDGNISQFLVRPIDYLAYRFWLYLSGRAVYTAVALCVSLRCILCRFIRLDRRKEKEKETILVHSTCTVKE